jgi:hypothetical protein
VKTHVSKFRFVSWDNGHSTFQITFGSKTYDSDGKLIANVPVFDRFGAAPVKDSDFRFHSKVSVNAVCTGNSETPGKSEGRFYTFSVTYNAESGEVTSVNAFAQPL